jgi:heme/copper-type cytochrome/quinol oxidase subunit 2
MRGFVIVDKPPAFDAWLQKQPTFTQATASR